jgi:hypothetical protein
MRSPVLGNPAATPTQPTRTQLVRASLLAILADHYDPMPTVQLEAAHGEFGQYIYRQLLALQRGGTVTRYRVTGGEHRSVYWWLPGRPPGPCVIDHCGAPGRRFTPPSLTDTWIRHAGRAMWRDIVEIPDTGGWSCADPRHAGVMFAYRAAVLRREIQTSLVPARGGR